MTAQDYANNTPHKQQDNSKLGVGMQIGGGWQQPEANFMILLEIRENNE